jgi:pimeloyl-ACP methyl ester carboxylesterase
MRLSKWKAKREMAWDFAYADGLQRHVLSHGDLRIAARGPSPILLFVHGGFHGAWCWSRFMRFLVTRNIPSAAVNMRGHGGLPQTPDFASAGLNEMVDDVVEAAAMLGGDVILVGHSLGALTAMRAAERINPVGLVLMAPAPPANVSGFPRLPAFPPNFVVAPPPPARARKWFLGGSRDDDIAPYVTRLCPESPALLNDCYHTRFVVDPAWVKGPVLCISGGNDDTALHPAGQDEAVAALYGAQLQKISEAGHCLMLDETWEASAAALVSWLQD